MDLNLTTALLGLILLALAGTAYFFLYRHHINRATSDNTHPIAPWPSPRRFLALGLGVLLLALSARGLWYEAATHITSIDQIQQQFYAYNQNRQNWDTIVAGDGELAVLLAYEPDLSDHSFSIYQNQGTWVTDLVFRYGGEDTSIERSLAVFLGQDSMVLLSLNSLHIAQITLSDGTPHCVSPDAPFALVLPRSEFQVFDSGGNPIDLAQLDWYRVTEL